MYGIMSYAVCRMKYAVREYASSLLTIVILTLANMMAPALTSLMITDVIVPALVLVEDSVNWVSNGRDIKVFAICHVAHHG